jgi:AcrR family transcriptional regulator
VIDMSRTLESLKGQDPRILRTKQQLRDALMRLLKEQPLSSISIQKITQTASITRGTFYLHYEDKQNFVEQVGNDLVQDLYHQVLGQQITGEGTSEARLGLRELFEYVEERQTLFRVLHQNENSLHIEQQLLAALRKELQQFVETSFAPVSQLDQIPLSIACDYLAGACMTLVFKWLADGLVYSPRYMAKTLRQLLQVQVTEIDVAKFFIETLQDLDSQA